MPPEVETLVAGGQPLSLATLVEDELLLALPMFAAHPENECPATAAVRGHGKQNPFSVLASLKKPGGTQDDD
jgi:uncharacterized metal-binding protein YceD (DUF177 family)